MKAFIIKVTIRKFMFMNKRPYIFVRPLENWRKNNLISSANAVNFRLLLVVKQLPTPIVLLL